jgi:hypothetical protein
MENYMEVLPTNDTRIERIEAINVGPNDIIVVTVDCGKLPPRKAEEYLINLKNRIKPTFPNNTLLVLNNQIDLSVLHMVEHPII